MGSFKNEWVDVPIAAEPVAFARLGCAVGDLCAGKSVAVACEEERSTRALCGVLSGGIQSAGAQVLDFGCVWRAMLDFCVGYTASVLGIYIPAGEGIQFVGPRKVLARQAVIVQPCETAAHTQKQRYAERIAAGGLQGLYEAHLLRSAPEGLKGTSACVRSSNREAARLLERTLASLGCDVGAGALYDVSADGTRLRITDGSLSLSEEQSRLLARRTGCRGGHDALQMTVHLLSRQRRYPLGTLWKKTLMAPEVYSVEPFQPQWGVASNLT